MTVFVVQNETRHEPELLVILKDGDGDQALDLTMDTLSGQLSAGTVAFEKDNNKITVDQPNEEQQIYSLRPLGGRIIVASISGIITNL